MTFSLGRFKCRSEILETDIPVLLRQGRKRPSYEALLLFCLPPIAGRQECPPHSQTRTKS
jgi:hypothetical protein